jgi:hypothetical protein
LHVFNGHELGLRKDFFVVEPEMEDGATVWLDALLRVIVVCRPIIIVKSHIEHITIQ